MHVSYSSAIGKKSNCFTHIDYPSFPYFTYSFRADKNKKKNKKTTRPPKTHGVTYLLCFDRFLQNKLGTLVFLFPSAPFSESLRRLGALLKSVVLAEFQHNSQFVCSQSHTHPCTHTPTHTKWRLTETKGLISFPLSSVSLEKQKEIAQNTGKCKKPELNDQMAYECGLRDSFSLNPFIVSSRRIIIFIVFI